MSRLIVKNLPNKISEDKLKAKFSEKGVITDLQLKYSKNGKFRNFAFIGYKTAEEALNAVNHFHETYFNTNKIKVELCSELGSSKPKPWSKYAKECTAKIAKIKEEAAKEITKESKIKGPKKKNLDPDLIEKLKKYKDDPNFREFLELHGQADKLLPVVEDDDVSEKEEESVKEESEQSPRMKLADAAISDLEYLKLKSKGGTVADIKLEEATDEPKKKYDNLFTIKIKNLPKTVKKSELKHLLKPLTPASIRRCKLKDKDSCMAYIGFKTQKEVRQALIKNKSFVGGKQILIYEHLIGSPSNKIPDRWKEQEETLKLEENIAESGKIFIRNLAYTVKEDDIEKLFSKFGPVTEVIVPIDKFTRQIKGYGVVTFLMPEHAVAAYSSLDGTILQGRMLHLLPGKTKDETENGEDNAENYKNKKEKDLKESAGISYNWNTLFLGQNAVADVVAKTYNATKQDLLTGSEAAVRLALGETQIVTQTRDFLIKQGVSLDAFNQGAKKRSKNVILVKNLPAGTTLEEIKEKFDKFGVLGRVVLPPSGITAIVEFAEPVEARAAFTKLAYSKFKHLPLYLEWAPEMTFSTTAEGRGEEADAQPVDDKSNIEKENGETIKDSQKDESGSGDELVEPEPDTTLFVKNLNFSTDENSLKSHFEGCGKIAEVSVARKKDPKNPGQMLSMGYGFIQYYFKSSLNDALIKFQGSSLDGHALELKRSNRTYLPSVLDTRKKTNVQKQIGKKILVRNIPFQANQKEIYQLFRAFGELKFVRLPKKIVGTGQHRGFAFVEFVTKHDAKQAMKALCQSTHLYGRRLVLEWAEAEEDLEDIRKRTAKNFLPSDDGAKRSKKAVADFDVTSDHGDE